MTLLHFWCTLEHGQCYKFNAEDHAVNPELDQYISAGKYIRYKNISTITTLSRNWSELGYFELFLVVGLRTMRRCNRIDLRISNMVRRNQ